MAIRERDLPDYCQNSYDWDRYVETVLDPIVPTLARAAADAVIDSRPATRMVLPFEADLLGKRLEPALRRMDPVALETLTLTLLDTVPSFEVWSEPLGPDDADNAYDAWSERNAF